MNDRNCQLRVARISRKDALTLLAGSGFFTVVSVMMTASDHGNREFGGLMAVGAFFFAIGVVVGLLNLTLPDRFLTHGIELRDTGFIFYRPLRRPKYIRFASIERIVVTALFEDDSGDSTEWWTVTAPEGTVRLDESMLYGTDILESLQRLPGFDNDAWSNCRQHDDRPLRSLIPHEAVIFETPRE
jgi:hypothetical protein